MELSLPVFTTKICRGWDSNKQPFRLRCERSNPLRHRYDTIDWMMTRIQTNNNDKCMTHDIHKILVQKKIKKKIILQRNRSYGSGNVSFSWTPTFWTMSSTSSWEQDLFVSISVFSTMQPNTLKINLQRKIIPVNKLNVWSDTKNYDAWYVDCIWRLLTKLPIYSCI